MGLLVVACAHFSFRLPLMEKKDLKMLWMISRKT
jgi:hypothetical protein